MKAKKNNKIKRIVAIYLAVVFVLSAVAIFGVSAKTVTKEHCVQLDIGDTEPDSASIKLAEDGRISDAFASYPEVPGTSYTTSEIRARAVNVDIPKYYGWKYFTLNENGGMVMVTYGTGILAGNCKTYYYYAGGGGCKAYSTLSATY